MAAVPIGFERWEPGQPWGDVVHDDGTRTSVPDPDGSIEAEARSWGARYNAQPKAAPAAVPQPALTGAASPPLPPSTPSPDVPAAPPLPSGAPLTGAEKAPLQASAQEQQALQGPPGLPPTGQSPAAQALADHGVDPSTLPKVGAPAAPGAAASPLSPALAAVQQHAPQLVAGKAEVKSEGPDAESAANIRGGSDLALKLKGDAIDQGAEAKALNNQGQAGVANQDYFDAWRAQQQAMGQMGALTKARDDAAAKLAQVKQAPIADHPDFPDWFVATSILGSIAGGFAEGFSGGRYKSSTLPMLQQIVGDWQNTQRYNKSNLISSLEEQLGDKNAALMAGGSRIKDELANMAESKAKFARTVEAQRELTATATGLRASALEDWTKAQAVVMGKSSESITLEQPRPGGPAYTNATLEKLRANGVDPKLWEKALGEQIKDGRQNAPSVAQTAASVKQIDSDRAMLESLSAANGGTLPTRGTINIPQALVPTLSRLGYKPGMQAEQVGQILGGYVMGRARSYGGAVTESDAAAAEKETGKTTEGVMRYLDRLRNQSNRALSTELTRFFPGREQELLEILLDRSSEGTTPGIPSPPVVPLEKQNGGPAPETPGGEMKPSAALNVSPEEQAKIDAEVAKTRAEEDRQRGEREAEVARRKPVERMKL